MKKYIDLARPFTLLPPLFGIISGAVCAWGSVHNPDPQRDLTLSVILTVALGSLCASFMNGASNALNQITDLEIDRTNKPKRPIVTGEISVRDAWVFTWVFYALALVPTWLVVVFPFSSFSQKLFAPLQFHECFFIYLAGLVFTFIYSVPSFGRTKRLGMWANWTIAVPRGCLLKVAGWSMVARIGSTEPWFIGSIFMLFLVGAASTKDFSDIDGDREGGCETLPVRHGVHKAAWMIAPFFVFPWLLIPVGVFTTDPWGYGNHAILTGNATALVVLSAILFVWGIYMFWLLVRNPDDLARVENHPSWGHMYMMMMTAQIGFGLAYLI